MAHRKRESLPHNISGISNSNNPSSLARLKNEAKRTAKGLFYPNSVIEAISDAKTESEITRILKTARQNSMGKDFKKQEGSNETLVSMSNNFHNTNVGSYWIYSNDILDWIFSE